MNERRKGFSLAEMLIALVVIGVIAALTIPVVVDKYQKTFYLSAFKKSYKNFSDVLNLALTEKGKTDYWDTSLAADDFFEEYLSKYIKATECDDCWVSDNSSDCGRTSTNCRTTKGSSLLNYNSTTSVYILFPPPSVPYVTYRSTDGSTIGFHTDSLIPRELLILLRMKTM